MKVQKGLFVKGLVKNRLLENSASAERKGLLGLISLRDALATLQSPLDIKRADVHALRKRCSVDSWFSLTTYG